MSSVERRTSSSYEPRAWRDMNRWRFDCAISSGVGRQTTSPPKSNVFSPSPGTPREGWGEGSSANDELFNFVTEPSPCPLPEYRERVKRQRTSANIRMQEALQIFLVNCRLAAGDVV